MKTKIVMTTNAKVKPLDSNNNRLKDCVGLEPAAVNPISEKTHLTMMVLLFPPRAFFRSFVKTESRYGTENEKIEKL